MLADELKTSNFPVSGQILVYPFLGGNMSLGSFWSTPMQLAYDKRLEILPRLLMPRKIIKTFTFEKKILANPPTIVIAAKNDPVYSDGFEYANKIRKFCGKALHLHGEGLVQ